MKYDFNMIIEEFTFFEQCTPRMQSDIITKLFDDFIVKFDNFFSNCEQAFINEIIVNLYIRRINKGDEMWSCGRKIQQMYFLSEGNIDFYTKSNLLFIQLPPTTVLGDYQILFNLKTNVIAKA